MAVVFISVSSRQVRNHGHLNGSATESRTNWPLAPILPFPLHRHGRKRPTIVNYLLAAVTQGLKKQKRPNRRRERLELNKLVVDRQGQSVRVIEVFAGADITGIVIECPEPKVSRGRQR
jgi:hypothetical protein